MVGVGLAMFTQAGPTNDESAKAALNDLLDRRYKALLTRDLDGYMSTVDPARTFLRECEKQRFETYVRLNIAPESVSVGRVDKYGDYLRVWIGTDLGWRRTFARYDGARWYLSEPTSNELGDDLTKEYAGVKVHYRAAEDDLASVVGEDIPLIVDRVTPHAAAPPARLFEVRIATLTGASDSCFIIGQAEGLSTTLITLKDVRLTTAYDHISRDTAATVEHEALHWLQHEHAARTGQDWWVIEGWPYLIAQPPDFSDRHFGVCVSAPTFEDLRFGVRLDAKAEDVTRAYIVAALLVERVDGSLGDRGYWQLFDAFDRPLVDPYIRITGAEGPSFYSTWLEDARRRYC